MLTTNPVPTADTRAPDAPAARPGTGTRLLFVDNMRTFLTLLVILFHMMIIYSGTGSWYYTEGREDFIAGALGAWFVATNQAYFMGLFLLISAYFVPGSVDRKGPGGFMRDRLIRLGIPLALYSWVIRPLAIYLDPVQKPGSGMAFWPFLTKRYFADSAIVGDGPLWFIETLLIFSAFYVLWRLITQARHGAPSALRIGFPGRGIAALFAVFLGVVSFAIRLWLPIGWNFEPLNLQFPFFAQYIAMFIMGLIAYRRNWFVVLPDAIGRFWLWIGVAMIFLFWPLVVAGGMDKGFDPFMGGFHWQALGYALWESFTCVSLCIGLVYLFRRRLNRQGKLAGSLSRSAYTAYLIHGIVITAVAYALISVDLHPLLKFCLASLIAAPLCFGLSALIRKLPYANRVLG